MKPRVPRRLFLELAASMLRGQPRSLRADAARLLQGLPAPPLIRGQEHVPRDSGFVMVANHYQRRDLWIGWAGALLIEGAGRPIRWLTLRELRLGGRELPLTRLTFTRVAQTYGFVPAPADLADSAGRAAAIRRLIGLVRTGEAIGFFPEGEHGHSGSLSPALPGSAELACLVSRYTPLVPAGVWQEGDRLCAAFGPPFRLEKPDPERLMEAIAGLLPRRA